jgi:predicted PP-loop superfamily ATPase
MKASDISELILDIRKELDLTRGVPPRIERIYTHEGTLHLITSDRAEKSLLLGPGGCVTAFLAKRTGKTITIYGEDELLLRRHRLELTLSRITELEKISTIQEAVLESLKHLIKKEIEYPANQIDRVVPFHHEQGVVLAFSGGVDSTASAVILKESGIPTNAVMIDLGYQYHNPRDIELAEDWCNDNGITITKISLYNNNDIIKRVDAGRIHPCGECHLRIMKHVRDYAIGENYQVIITGEMLPSGRQAISLDSGLMTIHLPAALALTKYRTEVISQDNGKKLFRRKFGCNLVAKSHSKGWRNIGPSIFRVLRELEAGILTTGQGLDYIKNILSNQSSEQQEYYE